MELALRMGRRMLGSTAPNPSVGAVIANERTGEVIARGWTETGGRPHAEVEVLRRAGSRAAGQTMYVTLEPCSHHGRTPPCADAILAARIGRVVCAIQDPDPRVSGKGLAILRDAGVAVDVGICSEQARWMAAGHILRMTRQRPFVQLKLAVSRDGLIAPGDGRPRWVTGEEARALGHLLRARADAILVGRQTVEADDPELTCRLPGLADRSPHRIVLDTHFRTPQTSRLVRAAGKVPVTIIGRTGTSVPHFPAGVAAKQVVSDSEGRTDLGAALRSLHDEGVTRLLVEGGPAVARSFLDRDLVDEVVLFRGTGNLGSAGLKPLCDRGIESFGDSRRWTLHDERAIGADSVRVYRARGRFGDEE